jgi:DNA-binding transcriptional LysR family regulator
VNAPRISLDQWRALAAVVDAGGYAQAAARLFKSQSAVTYAVQKLETVLGVKVFEIQGRRAVLTATGALLHRRALALIAEAAALENAAAMLAAGWEAELRLAVDVVFPASVLFAALARFGEDSPHTRIEIIESVLGGTTEALVAGQVDLALGAQIPPGWLGEPLLPLQFEPVAHPDHALHHLGRDLTLDDLRAHRQLVIRDSGSDRDASPLALEARQRWTVSNMSTAIRAVADGHGYGWYPFAAVALPVGVGYKADRGIPRQIRGHARQLLGIER